MDTHKEVIARIEGRYSDHQPRTVDGTKHSEALKLTACADLHVGRKSLLGGDEDCLDVVRVGRLVFEDAHLYAGSRTRTFVTAKGGGKRHVYRDIVLHEKARWCSFSLGDWTLYNHNKEMPPMEEVVIERVRREDGKRFIILQLFCNKVRVVDSPGAVVINLRWAMPLWFKILRAIKPKDSRSFEPIPVWL